jgi:hypothetical protein
MKKIAFALKVLGLTIMLPLYVFLEMNHATLPSNDTAPSSTQQQTKTISNASANTFIKSQKIKTDL